MTAHQSRILSAFAQPNIEYTIIEMLGVKKMKSRGKEIYYSILNNR